MGDGAGRLRGQLDFVHGSFSALESIGDNVKRLLRGAVREVSRPSYGALNAGFSSISDALSRASQGFSQRRQFNKAGPTGWWLSHRAIGVWATSRRPVPPRCSAWRHGLRLRAQGR